MAGLPLQYFNDFLPAKSSKRKLLQEDLTSAEQLLAYLSAHPWYMGEFWTLQVIRKSVRQTVGLFHVITQLSEESDTWGNLVHSSIFWTFQYSILGPAVATHALQIWQLNLSQSQGRNWAQGEEYLQGEAQSLLHTQRPSYLPEILMILQKALIYSSQYDAAVIPLLYIVERG